VGFSPPEFVVIVTDLAQEASKLPRALYYLGVHHASDRPPPRATSCPPRETATTVAPTVGRVSRSRWRISCARRTSPPRTRLPPAASACRSRRCSEKREERKNQCEKVQHAGLDAGFGGKENCRTSMRRSRNPNADSGKGVEARPLIRIRHLLPSRKRWGEGLSMLEGVSSFRATGTFANS